MLLLNTVALSSKFGAGFSCQPGDGQATTIELKWLAA